MILISYTGPYAFDDPSELEDVEPDIRTGLYNQKIRPAAQTRFEKDTV